ncbi:UbiA family prenyltransferase [Streptomyces sp. NBC_00846]|uniref:SCO3242 family prenyltransferase n=1 Tax=Streptomyces sp. NBC_00846 TaxID=2975849 RepID=UPI00386E5E24|nr:UbiA family prenyltransferase [Streptomyces sp. NBC_00846]
MTLRAWAELLRVSALFTVPGDALAGAAARGLRPDRGTALAVGASLCLYEAGMALNDWADRDEDAIDRPHRPIPSGRIAPGAALAAAGALTAAGLGLAARAGRPALAVAAGLAATVWAYDLRLKHTPAGPAAMAAARGLDLLLGAAATGAAKRPTRSDPAPGAAARGGNRGGMRSALPAAGLLGAHTYAVTAVSRHEAQGGSTTVPLAALAAVTALGAAALREPGGALPEPGGPGGTPPHGPHGRRRTAHLSHRPRATPTSTTTPRLLLTALTGSYFRTAAGPLLHAALNPSPPLTQRAVGGGIRAMIPLQAALAARAGAAGTGYAVMGLVPLARALARKVSPT